MKPGKAESLISYLLALGLAVLMVVSVILTEETLGTVTSLRSGRNLGCYFHNLG